MLFPFIAFLIWRLYENRKRSAEIVVLLILALFLIWMRFVEMNVLSIKEYDFQKNRNYNKELRVVVFSDAHIGVYNSGIVINKIAHKIKKIDPDIVIIPGDFVYFINKNKIAEEFSSLKDISIPILAVLGNHDYGKSSKDISRDLRSILESLGVLMVDNKIEKIDINGDIIEIIGTEDIWVANPDYEILKKDRSDSGVDFTFFVTHNPDAIYDIIDLSLDEYKKIDIMISGHTHAGQIRFPVLYKYIIPTKYNFDKGFYNISNIDLFITPGVGSVGLPLRLFNFPEISVLNIKY